MILRLIWSLPEFFFCLNIQLHKQFASHSMGEISRPEFACHIKLFQEEKHLPRNMEDSLARFSIPTVNFDISTENTKIHFPIFLLQLTSKISKCMKATIAPLLLINTHQLIAQNYEWKWAASLPTDEGMNDALVWTDAGGNVYASASYYGSELTVGTVTL